MISFNWQTLLFVAVGGALGSISRYTLTLLTNAWLAGSGFPAGTLLVNTIGSGLFGFLFAVLSSPALPSESLRAGVLIGFLGGLTTFSTFAADTVNLSQNQQLTMAFLNILANNTAAISFAFFGLWVARRIGFAA